MTALADFRTTLAGAAPPPNADPAVQGLWCDLVHAHLHRLEGDGTNAGYWYRRARRVPSSLPLATEWDAIATELLGQ